jgi:hypothetical protein
LKACHDIPHRSSDERTRSMAPRQTPPPDAAKEM